MREKRCHLGLLRSSAWPSSLPDGLEWAWFCAHICAHPDSVGPRRNVSLLTHAPAGSRFAAVPNSSRAGQRGRAVNFPTPAPRLLYREHQLTVERHRPVALQRQALNAVGPRFVAESRGVPGIGSVRVRRGLGHCRRGDRSHDPAQYVRRLGHRLVRVYGCGSSVGIGRSLPPDVIHVLVVVVA